MKKALIMAMVLLPIIAVAVKWRVWDGGIGGLVLALAAAFNCNMAYDESRADKD